MHSYAVDDGEMGWGGGEGGITGNAFIRGLEVSDEVLATGLSSEQLRVGDVYSTVLSSRAARLDVVQYIRWTPDVVVDR